MKEGSEEDYLAILPTCLYTGKGAPTPPEKNPRLKVYKYRSLYIALGMIITVYKYDCANAKHVHTQ